MSSPISVFGVLFRGPAHDMEISAVELGLSWDDSDGMCPYAAPYAPANGSLDALRVSMNFWGDGAFAASVEGAAPPHGDADNSMILPVVDGALAIPGIVGTTPQSGFRKISNVLVADSSGADGFAPQGRVFDGMDLAGYKLDVIIPCDQTNETFSAVIPAFLARQHGTYEFSSPSRQLTGSVTSGSARSYAANQKRQLSRARKGTLQPAGLTTAQVDQAIKWIRAVRGDAAAIPGYIYGPAYTDETVSVVIRNAKFTQQASMLWDGEIETWLSDATATKPTIWSITPAYIVSGAAANVVVRGSGFDASTAVTVGGVAATVTSWTSGTLAVTVSAGVAGQYEVIATNAQGSGTGTLWRYDAGEITFGTGGSIVATTAVAIAANQLVGINASGDAVLADAVLGIVAVGYAATTVASGGALQINQTGHATPVSGLTDGAQVFLGTAGGYASAPPSGATISQQVGIATATGVAVNCGDGATYL